MLFWCLRSLLSMIMSASTLTGKEGENNGVGSMKLKCRSKKVLYRHRVTCTTRPWSVYILQTRNPALGIWVLRSVVEWTSARYFTALPIPDAEVLISLTLTFRQPPYNVQTYQIIHDDKSYPNVINLPT